MGIYITLIPFKYCKCCGVSKEISRFSKNRSKKDGLQYRCKDCNKTDREENRERKEDYAKKYREEHREDAKDYAKKYREEHREDVKAHKQKPSTKAKRNARRKERLRNDPDFKILNCLRARLYNAIKGNLKAASTMELLGCSIEFFKSYLESQFDPWMSWDNYGHKTWHIDHIRPCSSFDFSDPEQQKECFHYTNLQPLAASENMAKGAKV